MYEKDYVQAVERPEKVPIGAQNEALDMDEKSQDGASSEEGTSCFASSQTSFTS